MSHDATGRRRKLSIGKGELANMGFEANYIEFQHFEVLSY